MSTLFSFCALVASLISHAASPLFAEHYAAADARLAEMSLDQKLAQTLLVRYPDDGTAPALLEQYQFGGYVFFAKDFQGKSRAEVQAMIQNLQSVARVPILTAVDEEGGLVVRVSSNPSLRPDRFLSPRELYQSGGLDAIRDDTLEKTRLLSSLGLNLNLAPVVDVSTDPSDYMFSRSLGQDARTTADFAKTVITASREENAKIAAANPANAENPDPIEASTLSYTLKHFPGYGNNSDTHQGTSLDQRSLLDLLEVDLLPFRAGLDAGAEAVLVSHNVVTALDSANPASLSPAVHALLTDVLSFTGVIITDDIAMGAISDDAADHKSESASVRAALAGNHLIITTDYAASLAELKSALARGVLSESDIDRMARQVLAWKSYKSLL